MSEDTARKPDELVPENPEGESGSPAVNPKAQWFTLQVFTGQEDKIKKYIELEAERQNLGELILSVHLPTQNTVEIRNGKKKIITKVRFPGYLFVQMVVDKLTMYFFSNIPNVMGFIGTDGRPTPLTEAEVLRIIGRTETGETLPEHQFQVGDKIKVIDGAFMDFEGVIHEINIEKKRLKVFVSIFGRATPLDLSFFQIEALNKDEEDK
jgi:transcriptional antiterminator NusG